MARSGTPAPLSLRFFGVAGEDWIASGSMEPGELERIEELFPKARFAQPHPDCDAARGRFLASRPSNTSLGPYPRPGRFRLMPVG
jgi:hypothetical protein